MEYPTLNKITTLLGSHFDKQLDEPFKRILAMRVDYWRGTLIGRTLRTHPNEVEFFRQPLFIAMEKASSLPSCIDNPLCPVLQTSIDIPTPLRFGSTLFSFVGSIDGLVGFRKVDLGTGGYLTEGRYSKRSIFWLWTGSRIQVINKSYMPTIRIDAVFDNPYQVMQAMCDAGQGCDFWDQRYPISNDILQACVECILKVDFNKQGELISSEDEIPVNNGPGRK